MKKEGTYVGLNISKESEKKLKQLQKDLDINESFSFHITLVYSRNKIKMDLNKKVNQTIKAEKFHIFDNLKSGGDRALVLFFDCPYCTKRNNYSKMIGGTWDYPTYESHITLSYNWTKDLPNNELLKDFKINITSEYYEKLNLDWVKDNIENKTNEKSVLESKEKKNLKEKIKNKPANLLNKKISKE